MARRHRHRKTAMRGGFLDTLSNWGTSFTQGANSLWEKTKSATTSATSGFTSSSSMPSSSSPSYTTPSYTAQTMSYGGKTRRNRRMRGGYVANSSTTDLASRAGSFSGPTAKAHTMVGGRTKRRGKNKKSRKNRRH